MKLIAANTSGVTGEEFRVGRLLLLDLATFRVTGRFGDGLEVIMMLVLRSKAVRRLLEKSGLVNCEDDFHEATSSIVEGIYRYLTASGIESVIGVVHCVKKIAAYKAHSWVSEKNVANMRHRTALNALKEQRSIMVDPCETRDEIFDLHERVSRLDFALPVNEIVWQCIVNRHSYSVRELQDYSGVSFRQAVHINKTLSDSFRKS